MTLGSETAALMAEFAKSEGKPLHEMDVEEARELSRALTALGLAPAPLGSLRQVDVAVPGGVVPLQVLTPETAALGVIVFIHGGGWVIGSAAEWSSIASHLAAATGCVVVLPDYRLAPEHPFPIPLDDCWAALQWAEQTFNLPLIVAGDSAGGNIAAVLARRARDLGGPVLAGQVLIYPVTDYDTSRSSWVAADNQQILTAGGMDWFWSHYIARPEDRWHPDASPLRAATLEGLPPTFLLLAEHDILHDEGAAYGDRLAAAGNDLTRQIFTGETHGFLTLGAALPAAVRGVVAIAEWTMPLVRGLHAEPHQKR